MFILAYLNGGVGRRVGNGNGVNGRRLQPPRRIESNPLLRNRLFRQHHLGKRETNDDHKETDEEIG